jgi:hypothetical protein
LRRPKLSNRKFSSAWKKNKKKKKRKKKKKKKELNVQEYFVLHFTVLSEISQNNNIFLCYFQA